MANSISRLNSLPDDVLADLEIAKEVALGCTSDDLSFMFKDAAILVTYVFKDAAIIVTYVTSASKRLMHT